MRWARSCRKTARTIEMYRYQLVTIDEADESGRGKFAHSRLQVCYPAEIHPITLRECDFVEHRNLCYIEKEASSFDREEKLFSPGGTATEGNEPLFFREAASGLKGGYGLVSPGMPPISLRRSNGLSNCLPCTYPNGTACSFGLQ